VMPNFTHSRADNIRFINCLSIGAHVIPCILSNLTALR
jgi:hypothetical protein